MTTEFDYTLEIMLRAGDLYEDIKKPPPGTEFLTKKRVAERQAALIWRKNNGKGSPTTGDKAIIKHYPLPEKPTTEPRKGARSQRYVRPGSPRFFARIVAKKIEVGPDGTCPITDRQAWNRLPVDADGFIEAHTPCEATTESRMTVTFKLSPFMLKEGDSGLITFKQFAKAWENEKDIPGKREDAKERKRLTEEAKEYFIRKGLLPKP